jgi:hypothetical protein
MNVLENKGLLKLSKEKRIKEGDPQLLWEQHLIEAISNVGNRIHQNNLRGTGNYMIFNKETVNIINNYLNG